MKTTVEKSKNEPILVRIIDFIESKGGISEVSGKIQWNYQTLNSIFKRGSSPKSDLLRDLAENYPDFDLNYIVTGEIKNSESKRIAELESDLALFKALLKNTVGKNKDTLQSPLVDREGSSDMLTSVINRNDVRRFVKILASVGKELAARNLN